MSGCWPCASRLRSIGWRSWLAASVLLTTVELVAWCVHCLLSGILRALSGWCSAAAAAALADVVSVGAGGDGLHLRRTPVMADRLAAHPDRTTPRIIDRTSPATAGTGGTWRPPTAARAICRPSWSTPSRSQARLIGMAESCPKCAITAQLGRQALAFAADGARSSERRVVESFTFAFHDPDSTATWNVDAARAMIARDPRPPLRLDPNWLKGWLATKETFDPGHLDHIPASKRDEPGILVRLANIEAPGAPITWAYILIDGSHRAALAVRQGRTFSAYLLTEEEQYAICSYTPADGETGRMPTLATAKERGWTHAEMDERTTLELAADWGPLHLSAVRRAWLELAYGYAWFAAGDYEISVPTWVLAAAALFVVGLGLLFIVAPR